MDKLLERLGVAREAMWMRSTTKETLGKVYPELFSLEVCRLDGMRSYWVEYSSF